MLSPHEIEYQFLDFMRANGAEIRREHPFLADGEPHRAFLADDKPGQSSVTYALYLDRNPNGWIHFYKGDRELVKWRPERQEQTYYRPTAQDIGEQKKNEAVKAKEKEEYFEMARKEFDAANPVSADNPYLNSKDVVPVGDLRQKNETLLIPLYDVLTGEFKALHRIYRDKDSKFQKRWAKGTCGGVFTMETESEPLGVIVAEGIATALSIHEALSGKYVVLSAMDAGNLKRQAQAIRQKYQHFKIYLAQDVNDHDTGAKTGDAVMTLGWNGVLPPPFSEEDFTNWKAEHGDASMPKDWNDYAELHGSVDTGEALASEIINAEQISLSVGSYNEDNIPPSPDFDDYIDSIESDEQPNEKFTFRYALNDIGNAQRLIDRHGENTRFVYSWNKWVVYDGKKWKIDSENVQMGRLASEVPKMLNEEADTKEAQYDAILAELKANGVSDYDLKSGIVPEQYKWQYKELGKLGQRINNCRKFAIQSGNRHCIDGMIIAARSGEASNGNIAIPYEILDRNRFLFNVGNGTLNLRTAELQQFSREDYITRRIPTKYRPSAKCPDFLRFLDLIFENDKEIINYLQKAFGYCLTGDVNESPFYLLVGKGRNGKGALMKIISLLFDMNNYAGNLPIQVFNKKNSDRLEGRELAMLYGKRFVTASEPEEGMELNEALIKMITGGDPVSCRRMREDMWTYYPEYKLFLNMNSLPVIKETSNGIWNRIKVIPFNITIPEKERDPQFADKLFEREAEGILAWIVEGCSRYMQEGLITPESIRALVSAYRSKQDILTGFFMDCCELGKDYKVEKIKLYQAYQKWCEINNEHDMTTNKFTREMSKRGYERNRTTRTNGERRENVREFIGIALK